VSSFDGAKVRLDRKFKKRLDAKDPSKRAAVLECIVRLIDDPSHPSLRTHPVQGTNGIFSSRIDRGNRITWERDGDIIVLRNHCNHDDVYNRP
jgi:hypothetical protein